MMTDQSYSPAFDPMGFPVDTMQDYIPPGFASTTQSVAPTPAISTAQSWWDTIKQNSQSALQWVSDKDKQLGAAIIDTVKDDYALLKGGVSTVASDVEAPIESGLKSTFWYAIVGVVVIAGAIYFIGKGGAIKVNANV